MPYTTLFLTFTAQTLGRENLRQWLSNSSQASQAPESVSWSFMNHNSKYRTRLVWLSSASSAQFLRVKRVRIVVKVLKEYDYLDIRTLVIACHRLFKTENHPYKMHFGLPKIKIYFIIH
jgi:hypothetical protein